MMVRRELTEIRELLSCRILMRRLRIFRPL
jgi:hypothetical protein